MRVTYRRFIVQSVQFLAAVLVGITGPRVLLAYSEPTLKVLIFQSQGTVRLTGNTPLQTAAAIQLKNSHSLMVKPVGRHRVMLDNKHSLSKPIFIHSNSAISVQKPHTEYRRRFKGKIEIVPAQSGFYIINHIPVESYLEGVLNAEISTKWPIEVVKAQTVISRTFALYQKEKRANQIWHVTSDISDQVYKGADIADQTGLYAIQQTRGIVVTHNGMLAQTFYHSNCGGVTEDAGSMWSKSYPYLTIKQVPSGQSDPRYYWETELSDREIDQIFRDLGYKGGAIKSVKILAHSPSGRVSRIGVNNSPQGSILAKDFRRRAGYSRIQSLLFQMIKVPGGYAFKGRGNGHGVGLSQWSAKEMAESGYRYHEILHYFYTGTQLARYWN